MADDVIKFTILADDKASAAFSKTFSVLSGGVNVAKKLGVAVVGASAAIVGFTNHVSKAIDKQAKFATRIGVSVAELTAYQHVAALSGLSTETFNMATQRMTRRVAEAAKGLGEAQGALRDLGIDAKDFNNLGLSEKMQVLSDRMAGVTDEGERLRLAFKLFDSEGTAMLQMLNQNSDALKAAEEDARRLGLVIGEQAAKQAELFQDAMGRAGGAIKGVSNGIAGELMPLLTGLANRFADALADARGSIVTFVKNGVVNLFVFGDMVRQTFEQIGNYLTSLEGFKTFLKNAQAFSQAVVNTLLQVALAIPKALAAALGAFKAPLQSLAENIKNFFAYGETWKPIEFSASKAAEEMKNRFMESMAETKDNLLSGFEEVGAKVQQVFGVDMAAAKENAQAAILTISEFAGVTKEKIAETGEQISELMVAIGERQVEFEAWLGQSSQQFAENLFVTIQNGIDGLSTALASAIMTGQSLADAFKNVMKQVVTSIIAGFIKMGIQRAIFTAMGLGENKVMATAEASKAVGLAGANMFASWAAAPWPISMGAPAAAAAAIAGAASMFTGGAATGAALGASIGGIAHGGLTNNPDEQTFLLKRGERVLSPRQNEDFTRALAEGGIGGGVQVDNLSIVMFPNATNADAVFNMDSDELAGKIEDATLTALNNLDRRGIRPSFAERTI